MQEWHLKCNHYVVVCALTGECKDTLRKLTQVQGNVIIYTFYTCKV